jgi:hypothetical protein
MSACSCVFSRAIAIACHALWQSQVDPCVRWTRGCLVGYGVRDDHWALAQV